MRRRKRRQSNVGVPAAVSPVIATADTIFGWDAGAAETTWQLAIQRTDVVLNLAAPAPVLARAKLLWYDGAAYVTTPCTEVRDNSEDPSGRLLVLVFATGTEPSTLEAATLLVPGDWQVITGPNGSPVSSLVTSNSALAGGGAAGYLETTINGQILAPPGTIWPVAAQVTSLTTVEVTYDGTGTYTPVAIGGSVGNAILRVPGAAIGATLVSPTVIEYQYVGGCLAGDTFFAPHAPDIAVGAAGQVCEGAGMIAT